MSFVFINRSHYMDLRRAFNFLFQVLPNVSRYDPRTENNELITPRKPIFHSTCHSFYPNYKQDYYSVLFVFLQCIDQFLKSFKVMHMVRRIIPHNDLKSAVTIAMLTMAHLSDFGILMNFIIPAFFIFSISHLYVR